MANKLSFDINMNTAGYVQGARQAQQSTKDLEKSTNKYLKEFGSLRKELGAAKKEAQNLAMEFSQLSKTEKQSDIGKQMAKDLNFAIEKAAELQDVMGDVNESIKNAASDTAGLDAFKEAMTIGKNVATTYAGAVAKLTGNDKALTDVVSNLAMIEGGFNTVISVSNALQKQSALMKGINIIQTKALTAATNSGTVAQAAFNAVANANPYVLLASVAAAAALAIGGYMLVTSKATTTEEKHQLELKKTREEFQKLQNSVNNSVAKILSDYKSLQFEYRNLRTEYEKSQFLDENKSKFESMGLVIDNVNELEDVLVNKTNAVAQALKARAEAEAWGDIYREKLRKKLERDLNPSRANNRYITRAKEGDKASSISEEEARELGIKRYDTKYANYGYGSIAQNVERELTATEALRVNIYRAGKAKAELAKEDDELRKIEDNLTNSLTNQTNAMKELGNLTTKNNTSDKTTPKPEIKTTAKVDQIKIDTSAVEKDEKLRQQVQDILNNLFYSNKTEAKYDFSGLSESLQKEANNTLEELNRVKQAQDDLFKLRDTASTQEQYDYINEAIYAQSEAYDELNTKVQRYAEESKKALEHQKKISDMIDIFNKVGDSAQSLGTIMTNIGEAGQDSSMKAAGIIAQALSTLALTFAESMKGSWTVWDWIAGGLSGIAVLTSMSNQIKSINKYAEGGVIGGSSFSGDRLLARVNSGEMIFNSRQQKRLYEIANGTGYIGNNTVHIIGTTKVNGGDLDIVWTNYNRINKRAR